MSQMIMEEEEKEPGDFERLPGPDLAPAQAPDNAPDDGFLRPQAAAQDQMRGWENLTRDMHFPPRAGLSQLLPERKPALAKARGKHPLFADEKPSAATTKVPKLPKQVNDLVGIAADSLPKAIDKIGDASPQIRGAADTVLEAYAPAQEAMQRAQPYTKAISDYANPGVALGKVAGKDVKLALPAEKIAQTAASAITTRKFQKGEKTDPASIATDERAAYTGVLGSMQRARAKRSEAKALIGALGVDPERGYDPTSAEGQVHDELTRERKRATASYLRYGARAAIRGGQLAQALEKKGIRARDEMPMEQTAYLNNRTHVPPAPLESGQDEGKHRWAPTTGMIDMATGTLKEQHGTGPAAQSAFARYRDEGADSMAGTLPVGVMGDMVRNAELEKLPDGHREDVEGGRAMQRKVAALRGLGGGGRLLEGTIDRKGLRREGRYGAAYGAAAASLAKDALSGAGGAAATAGLAAATGSLAPMVALAKPGQKLVGHGLEQAGMGLQSLSEWGERKFDPLGLAREQDNRDAYNRAMGPARGALGSRAAAGLGEAIGGMKADHFAAPLEAVPEEGESDLGGDESLRVENESDLGGHESVSEGDSSEPVAPNQVPADPVADLEPIGGGEQLPTGVFAGERDATVERGKGWRKQGDRAIVGRPKRTWGRAIKDVTWGGLQAAGKGIKELVTLPWTVLKGLYKGGKAAGSGIAAGASAAGRYFTSSRGPRANPARDALMRMRQDNMMPVTDRAQFNWASLQKRDIDALSKDDQNEMRLQREKYNEVFGPRPFARAPRGKGTRHAAFAELLDRPHAKAADERVAFGHLLAPAPGAPQVSRQEKLADLRARAQQRIDRERGVDNDPADLFGDLPLRDRGEGQAVPALAQAPVAPPQAPVAPAQEEGPFVPHQVGNRWVFGPGPDQYIEEEEKEA